MQTIDAVTHSRQEKQRGKERRAQLRDLGYDPGGQEVRGSRQDEESHAQAVSPEHHERGVPVNIEIREIVNCLDLAIMWVRAGSGFYESIVIQNIGGTVFAILTK